MDLTPTGPEPLSPAASPRLTRMLVTVVAAVVLAGGLAAAWATGLLPAFGSGAGDDGGRSAAVVDHSETAGGAVPPERSPDVPDLPFADNPDPTQCGIPVPWSGNEQAWLSGFYQDELIQPEVMLYESHLRLRITASAPHGTEVRVLLHQPNPVLDYYLVDLPDQQPAWIPAPFLSFDEI